MTQAASPRRRKLAGKTQTKPVPDRSRAVEVQDEGGGQLAAALALIAQTRVALLTAQAALEAIVRDSIDPAEQAAAAAGILRIERELALLEARRRELVDGSATLDPPSADDIAEAQRIAGKLGQIIAANAKAAAIVGLVADAVSLAAKLQG